MLGHRLRRRPISRPTFVERLVGIVIMISWLYHDYVHQTILKQGIRRSVLFLLSQGNIAFFQTYDVISITS